jgi:hypothetical protein
MLSRRYAFCLGPAGKKQSEVAQFKVKIAICALFFDKKGLLFTVRQGLSI